MKKALLVGINHYQMPGNSLEGCVNDVNDMKQMLMTRFGYAEENIVIITNEQATKAGILEQLEKLVGPGCTDLVFHYSGHGTQWFDTVENMNNQAICPYDVHDYDSLLKDEELGLIFRKIGPGCKLTFIADCCHSGTIDRIMDLPFIDKAKIRVKRMIVPGLCRPNRDARTKKREMTLGATSNTKTGMKMLLSGCKDEQTSADATFENRPNGALTYAVLQEVKRDSTQTWRNLHAKVVSWLKKGKFQQSPQLSGPKEMIDNPIFS